MPCVELFEEQSDEYKESVLPHAVTKRIAVEASSDLSWYRYLGIDGKLINMTTLVSLHHIRSFLNTLALQ